MPVSMRRTVSGYRALTVASSSTPFMPGMRMSETITANGPASLHRRRAASPLVAVWTV